LEGRGLEVSGTILQHLVEGQHFATTPFVRMLTDQAMWEANGFVREPEQKWRFRAIGVLMLHPFKSAMKRNNEKGAS
jgi:hypothetical protein